MKHVKWISALMLLFVPLIAVAQLGQTQQIAAQVPFKFTVGDIVVPAGDVRLQLADEKGWVLTVSNRDTQLSIFALALPSAAKKAAPDSVMVFHKYGSQYFLASMGIADSPAVYEFRPSKLENELRAQNLPASQEVLRASAR